MNVFVFDLAKCNGCYNCQIACKDEHVGNTWLPYAKPQPDTGQFWMKMDESTHGQIPKLQVNYEPHGCMHCENPVCGSPGDAIYTRNDGLVILDPEKAADKAYVDACPYGAIYWNDELGIAQKCTGCAHLVDEGHSPHCVDLCPTGALRFGDEKEFVEEIAQAEVLNSEYGTKPRVFYLNRRKLFIAGDVWDPEPNEIVEGARVSLYDEDGLVSDTVTDNFGDFWFKQLDSGEYRLVIDAEGYQLIEKEYFRLDKSLNLGDFPLAKA